MNTDDDQWNTFILGLGIGCMSMIILWALILVHVERRWERDAIKAGAAEYYLDAEYNRQWRWKTNLTKAENP